MKTDINRNISNGVAEDQKEGKEIMLKYDANIKVIFTIPLKMFCAQKCHIIPLFFIATSMQNVYVVVKNSGKTFSVSTVRLKYVIKISLQR